MNRQQIAQNLILNSLKSRENPWKIIGRDLIIVRACGCIRKLGKNKGKGRMDSHSQIRIAEKVANSYCEKHGDEFLLLNSGRNGEWK